MGPVHYQVYGHGHPLILLHGFCETSQIWSHFAKKFPPGIKIYTPDLPGFGKSILENHLISIEDVAGQLNSWVKELKLHKPVIIGHSLGGYVALAMHSLNPGSISGLGLFHSTAAADSEEKKQNRLKVIDFVKTYGVKKYIETFVPGLFYQKSNKYLPEVVSIANATKLETFVAYTHAMRNRPSKLEVLSSTEIPMLILAGEHDSGIPVETMKEQASLSPKIDMIPLPNTGHMGLFESEKLTSDRIIAFILGVFGGA